MTKRQRLTAAELMARLNADPEFVRRHEQQDREHAEGVARQARAMAPLRSELEIMGVEHADDLALLVRRYAPLPAPIVQVLLRWFSRIEEEGARESIVRALAASGVPFDGAALVRAFQSTRYELFRWAVANTLASADVTGVADWTVEALRDRSVGKAREMLAVAAARLAAPERANAALLEVFEELPGHAAAGLAISGGVRELEFLRARQNDGKAWERQEIQKAIQAIEMRRSRT